MPFLIFPFIYFVPDEHHEREAAARLSEKSLTGKSMKSVRRGSTGGGGEGVELQKIEPANGKAKTAAAIDEEATMGTDTEDFVDYIPGKQVVLTDTRFVKIIKFRYQFLHRNAWHVNRVPSQSKMDILKPLYFPEFESGLYETSLTFVW